MTASFEGKLHAFRRTQDGVVISYVVHPNDVSAAMATAPLGTRYMIGFAEIGEDGKPVETKAQPLPMPIPDHLKPSKDRRPFASLPLSQQAAMRTQDSQFQDFLHETMSSVRRGGENWTWADEVRTRCACQESRSEIVADTTQGRLWVQLEADYQAWLTTQRYASVAR